MSLSLHCALVKQKRLPFILTVDRRGTHLSTSCTCSCIPYVKSTVQKPLVTAMQLLRLTNVTYRSRESFISLYFVSGIPDWRRCVKVV